MDKDKNTQENEDAVKKHLQKQFQELGKKGLEVPNDLQKDVFNTIDTLNFLGDFVDLFTAKFVASEADMLNLIQAGEDEEEELPE